MTSVITALLFAGGIEALRSAMILVALPFSFVMSLMAISLVKALILDEHRLRPAD